MPTKRIYLDNHATTPVDSRVLDTMLPYFNERFGNAASKTHPFGWEAEAAVEIARKQIADLIGADAREIVFTSGATEAINLALKGVFEAYGPKGRHYITARAEHKAVLDTCRHLEQLGARVTYVPVRSDGSVDPEAVREAIQPDTALISVMLANNEVGTINTVREIGAIASERGILMHSDIAQAAGKIAADVNDLHVDLASLSGHKIYGPKGVGALFVRRRQPRVRLVAQMDGGGHENGMRSGTLNVPAIVGIGRAAELCRQEMEKDFRHTAALRNRLFRLLEDALPDLHLNGPAFEESEGPFMPCTRLPNNLNVSFPHVDGEGLILALKDIAVSTGSACTSASPEPSHVLQAMGLDGELMRASLRFGVGRFNAEEEIDLAAERVIDVVRKLKNN
jgi:cysteine desulfurase